MTENNLWYAIMIDSNDNDWGYGFHDINDAIIYARCQREIGYHDCYIAVIRLGNDPVCIDEIHDF